MEVGDKVRFWTKDECATYYQGTYTPKNGIGVIWGGIATVMQVDDSGKSCRIRFEDGRETWCGMDTIHKYPMTELEERIMYWNKVLGGSYVD